MAQRPLRNPSITRREFVALTAAGIWSCGRPAASNPDASEGRLRSTPAQPTGITTPGAHELQLASGRDGVLYVPKSGTSSAAPLAVLSHGAGGAARSLTFSHALADELGMVLLIPESRGDTWDAIRGGLGPDVAFIDAALAHTFARCAIDASRIALGGFSDGASYALSLGTMNGDLFTHLVAFSPGFIVSGQRRGKPRLFISHGTRDRILPIDETSRVMVPALRRDGYDVTYREFDGPHTVPPEIARAGFEWFTGRSG